jgi:hypothetical protein
MSNHKGFLSEIFNDAREGIDCGNVELKMLYYSKQKFTVNNVNYIYDKIRIIIDQKDKNAKFFFIYDSVNHFYYVMRNKLKRKFKNRTSIYLKQIQNQSFIKTNDLSIAILELQKLTDIMQYLKKRSEN